MAEETAPTTQNLFPSLRYRDAKAAIEWLKQAFGFEEVTVIEGDDGTIHHAELRLGPGIIMLGAERRTTTASAATRGRAGSTSRWTTPMRCSSAPGQRGCRS